MSEPNELTGWEALVLKEVRSGILHLLIIQEKLEKKDISFKQKAEKIRVSLEKLKAKIGVIETQIRLLLDE